MKRRRDVSGREVRLSKTRTEQKSKDQRIAWSAFQGTSQEVEPVSLENLLYLGWKHRGAFRDETNPVNWVKLWLLTPVLTELKNMIGMKEIKESVVDFVVCAIQGFVACKEKLHTIISGPPGCGKTQVAKILAKIYHRLGFVATDNFLTIKRDDLTGFGSEKELDKYLNQVRGGTLFIDCRMSISGIEKGIDSFTSVVDLLNRKACTGKDPEEPVCIVSGTEGELEKYLFFIQSGVKSIFSLHFSIPKYTPQEMVKIFKIKAKKEGWRVEDGTVTTTTFIKNPDLFTTYGRDISGLFDMCLVSHLSRCFSSPIHKIITKEDVLSGLIRYKKSKKDREDNIQTYFG